MKYHLLALALLIPLMANCKSVNGESVNCKLRWGTFNIRLQNPGDEKAGYGL